MYMFCETLVAGDSLYVYDRGGTSKACLKQVTPVERPTLAKHRKEAIEAARFLYDRNCGKANLRIRIVGLKLNRDHYGWILTLERKPTHASA